jgi:hypothetical protein
VFTFWLLVSQGYEVPLGVATWAEDYRINAFAVGGAVALTGLVVALTVGRQREVEGQAAPEWVVGARWLTLLAAGFLASFLLHLVVLGPTLGWAYLLIDFKMLFWRGSEVYGGLRSTLRLRSFLGESIPYGPGPYLAHAAALGALLVGIWRGWVRLDRRGVVACLAATALALLSAFLGARFNLRDMLWQETPLNLLSALYLLIVLQRGRGPQRRWLLAVGVVSLTLAWGAGVRHAVQAPLRLDANYNLYGWRDTFVLRGVYGGNQRLYGQVLHTRYGEAPLRPALRQARRAGQARRDATFVFPSLSLDQRQVGVAAPGYPVWCDDDETRLGEVPPPLIAGLVVDAVTPIPGRWPFYEPDMVRAFHEGRDKLREGPAYALAVLARWDLEVLVFVDEGDREALVAVAGGPAVLGPSEHRLTLDGPEPRALVGLVVHGYAELPLAAFSRRPVFMIRRK